MYETLKLRAIIYMFEHYGYTFSCDGDAMRVKTETY